MTLKFGQLPTGKRFRYRDESYQKDSPLQARRESDGTTKLIPRSAVITPLDTEGVPITERPMRIERTHVERALKALETELTTAIARTEPALDADQQRQLQTAIALSYACFIKRLALD